VLLAPPPPAQVEITAGGTTRLLTAVHDGDRSTVTVNGVPSAWRVGGASGELDPALLADPAAGGGAGEWRGGAGGCPRPPRAPPIAGRSATARRLDGCPWGSRPSCTR